MPCEASQALLAKLYQKVTSHSRGRYQALLTSLLYTGKYSFLISRLIFQNRPKLRSLKIGGVVGWCVNLSFASISECASGSNWIRQYKHWLRWGRGASLSCRVDWRRHKESTRMVPGWKPLFVLLEVFIEKDWRQQQRDAEMRRYGLWTWWLLCISRRPERLFPISQVLVELQTQHGLSTGDY